MIWDPDRSGPAAAADPGPATTADPGPAAGPAQAPR